MTRQIFVLAAGKGTRIGASDLPKVLFPLNDQPIINWLLAKLNKLKIKIYLIIGYQGEKIIERFGNQYQYVWQMEQLGTGHAVQCAFDEMKDLTGNVLVLYGDMPLIKSSTIEQIFHEHEKSNVDITMMTTMVENFVGQNQCFMRYGRIIRNNQGEIIQIKEFSDCNDKEKNIKELNPGYYCFSVTWLRENIGNLRNKNQSQEYYLTDLIELAVRQQEKINDLAVAPEECLGINTLEELDIVSKIIT